MITTATHSDKKQGLRAILAPLAGYPPGLRAGLLMRYPERAPTCHEWAARFGQTHASLQDARHLAAAHNGGVHRNHEGASASGEDNGTLVAQRPSKAPHHTVSTSGLAGCGSNLRMQMLTMEDLLRGVVVRMPLQYGTRKEVGTHGRGSLPPTERLESNDSSTSCS